MVGRKCVERGKTEFLVNDPRARRDVDDEFGMVSCFLCYVSVMWSI